MRKSSVRNTAVAVGVTAVVGALSLGTTSSASAASVSPNDSRASVNAWDPLVFNTAGDCQYYGNVLAQQGVLWGFRCVPWGNGWALIPS